MKKNHIYLQLSFLISTILYLFLQTNLIFDSFAINFTNHLLILKNISLTFSIIILGYFSLEFGWTKMQAHLSWIFIVIILIIFSSIMVGLNFMGLYGHWVKMPDSQVALSDFISYLTYKTGIIYITLFFTLTYLIRIILFKKDQLRSTKLLKIIILIILITLVITIIGLIIMINIFDYQNISHYGFYKRMNFFYSLEEPTMGSIIFVVTVYFIGLSYNYFQINKFFEKKFINYHFIIRWVLLLILVIIYFTSSILKSSHSSITLTNLFISFGLFFIISILKSSIYNKKINNIFNTSLIMSGIGLILVYIINFTLDYRSIFFITFIKNIYSNWILLTLWTFLYLLVVYFICYLIKKIVYYLISKLTWHLLKNKDKLEETK